MIERRPSDKGGAANHGWLKAKHHFSFARYYDPERIGHGSLRVWNDDEIAPDTGFPPHPHADMEIITYVRERDHPPGQPRQQGAHRCRRRPGDERRDRTSAIPNYNLEIQPTRTRCFRSGSSPGPAAKPFVGCQAVPPKANAQAGFAVASGFAVTTRALRSAPTPADRGATPEGPARPPSIALGEGRRGYLVAAGGAVEVNGVPLAERDGAAIHNERHLRVAAIEDAEIILVDVP